MRAILDTHVILWWVTNNPQLSQVVRDIIADSENTLYLSVASSWEIIIKFKTGKLPLPELPTQFIQSCLSVNCFESLAIDLPHVLSRVTGEMRSHTPKTQTRSGDESSRHQTRCKGETAFSSQDLALAKTSEVFKTSEV